MITSSNEPYINKSAVNRHSCIITRKRAPVKFIPSAPVNKNTVKKKQEKTAIETVINEEPEKQIILENRPINIAVNEEPEKQIVEENYQESVENQPIEPSVNEEPIKVSLIEDVIQTTVNTPVERKVEIKQHNVSKILNNRVVNTGRHYTYNSILGAVIRHD